MTENGGMNQELFHRQMLLTGHRVPILLGMGNGKITMDRIHEEAGAHVGGITSGTPSVLATTKSLEQAETLPFALRHLFCDKGVSTCTEQKYKYDAHCWADRADVPDPPKKQNEGYGGQVARSIPPQVGKERERMLKTVESIRKHPNGKARLSKGNSRRLASNVVPGEGWAEGWETINDGRQDIRRLKAPPPPLPDDMIIEVAIDGVTTHSYNATELKELCEPHAAYNAPLCVLLDDEEMAKKNEKKDVKLSFRIIGGGRES
eukprot:scaffold217_cov64-Cyclotella_meneghiniana.AAC.1